jgi:hypothetical protein
MRATTVSVRGSTTRGWWFRNARSPALENRTSVLPPTQAHSGMLWHAPVRQSVPNIQSLVENSQSPSATSDDPHANSKSGAG